MKKILVVVDMQNDFITGPLGTPEAVSIVDKVAEKIRGEEWDSVFVTYDSHNNKYLETQEGRKLPIEHCILHTDGWNLNCKIFEALNNVDYVDIGKTTFGSKELIDYIWSDLIYSFNHLHERNVELTLVGVCTDICVISNALLLKAHYPEMKIVVDASCCAGSTPVRHQEALDIMRSCQIDVINNDAERINEFYKSILNAVYGAPKESEE